MHLHMDPERPLLPVDLLVELLQGYRYPAAATNEHGAIVCMNAAAVNEVNNQPHPPDQILLLPDLFATTDAGDLYA